MELKPAQKQTEIGVIPENWERRKLEEITDCLDHLRVPLNERQRMQMRGDYPYCGANGILDHVDNYVVDDDIILLAEDGGYYDEYTYRPIAYRMIGRCWVNNHAHILKAKAGVNQDFIFHSLEHKNILRFLASGTRAKLNRSEMNRIEIDIPRNEKEQRVIGSVLSDTDALIRAINQLIAKKRDIKQGTMKELLTGRRRLPGFSGGWIKRRLGDISHIKTGNRNNQDKCDDGEYPFFVRSATVERINSYSYDCEAILIPGEGGIEKIFHYIVGRFDVHQRVYAITNFSETISGQYVFYYMASNFGQYAMKNTVKATVDSLRLPTFQDFVLEMPQTIEEQTAITTTLSDIDTEIVALEEKLTKAKHLKQGMRQTLLSGRTRLA